MDTFCNPYFSDTFGILLWITQNLRYEALTPLMKGATMLGGGKVLLFIAIAFYWLRDQPKGHVLLSAFFWSVILSAAIKYTYLTCRPPSDLWIGSPDSYSFPSGHSQVAATVWFGLAYYLKQKPLKILCVFLAFLVAFSRLYLGLHYPADVLAGMGFGLLVLVNCIYADQHECTKLSQIPFYLQSLFFFTASLLIAFISVTLLAPDPHLYMAKCIGGLFGLWLGMHTMRNFPPRIMPTSVFKAGIQFGIGCIGIGVLWGLFHFMRLPQLASINPRYMELMMIWTQYALIGNWIAFGAPRLIDRLMPAKP